jgi:protocatechuate 3,4-dioxygenase beta subunit
MVEIWQACQTGRYSHPGDDDNPAPLDPNFQYWGIAITDADGKYDFKTIVPGHYPAGEKWIRPPHIHFKVHKLGIRELITQMYFAGNQYNESDLILKNIPRNEWPSVVRETTAREPENGRAALDINFDITVERLV